MSGFYYVLQRLGTVSLIKQIILEGKATGKRRRKTGGKCVFATHSDKKKKKKGTAKHTPTQHTLCACSVAAFVAPSCFPHSMDARKALVCLEETQVQTIVMKSVDADSQTPSNL